LANATKHRGLFKRFLNGKFLLGAATGLAFSLGITPFLTQSAYAFPTTPEWHGASINPTAQLDNSAPSSSSELADVEAAFPNLVHVSLFGDYPEDTEPTWPIYLIDDSASVLGQFNASTLDGIPFTITTTEVLVEWDSIQQADPLLPVQDIDIAEQWIENNNFVATVVRATLTSAISELNVIGMAMSTSDIVNGTQHTIIIIESPETHAWGEMEFSTELAFHNTVEAPIDGQSIHIEEWINDEYSYSLSIPLPCTEIEQECLDAAVASYQFLVDQANADWQERIDNATQAWEIAKAAFETARAALLARKAIEIALAIAACAALAFIPFVGAAAVASCIVRVLVRLAAIYAANRLALHLALVVAKALYEAALDNAWQLLRLALSLAARVLQAALEACCAKVVET
jgi:hypothetical protein